MANNPFVWNDASGIWMHVKTIFHATAGATVIHTTYTVERPMNIGYFGMIQAGAISGGSYDHQYYYIPKTKPISGYDFTGPQLLDTAPASTVNFDSAHSSDPSNPPDREVIYFKKNADDNYDLGFAFGYSPYLAGDPATRSASCITHGNNCWEIYTSKKSYPTMIGNLGVVSSATYEGYAYRQWIDPKQYDINKSAYWNNVNGHDLVYVDYHKSVTNDTTALPSSLVGENIRVVDSQNVTTSQTTIPSDGLKLSTTGGNTYGYIVLELTPQDITLQSTACPSQSGYCNNSQPDISVNSPVATTTYHYSVDQNQTPDKTTVEAGTSDADGSFAIPPLLPTVHGMFMLLLKVLMVIFLPTMQLIR